MTDQVRATSRRLRDLCEPIAGSVYFVQEAHDNYKSLGLEDFAAGYFPSRGACLGRPTGPVVTAAFGVFNPDIVHPHVDSAWTKTTPEALLEARERGATDALIRMCGDADPSKAVVILKPVMDDVDLAGRPLFSGLRSLPFPEHPLGQLWRVCDYVRERRGDGHIAAWISHGCDPTEISLLTELFWKIPLASYAFTRGWNQEQIDAGIARLEDKGFIKDREFTDEGREYRRSIEAATDVGEKVVVDALGDRAEELFDLLEPFTTAVLDARGYPVNPVATMSADQE